MSSLSYQEKSLYGSLFVEVIVYGSYFLIHRQNSVGKVAGTILAIIVLQIVLQSIIAALTRNRITDERDRLIQLRGYRVAYITLVSLMVFGIGMLWLHVSSGHFPINKSWVGLHFLTVFFGMLVISDIVKTISQIVAYRRAL